MDTIAAANGTLHSGFTESSCEIQLRASEIARRRTEEERWLICTVRALICSVKVVSRASSAAVMWVWAAPWWPVAPRGAATSREYSSAGWTPPL